MRKTLHVTAEEFAEIKKASGAGWGVHGKDWIWEGEKVPGEAGNKRKVGPGGRGGFSPSKNSGQGHTDHGNGYSSKQQGNRPNSSDIFHAGKKVGSVRSETSMSRGYKSSIHYAHTGGGPESGGGYRRRSDAIKHVIRSHRTKTKGKGDGRFQTNAQYAARRTAVKKSEDTFSINIPIAKIDEDQMLAFGWAQVAVRKDGTILTDKQGDEIHDITHLEKAGYNFVLNSRDGGEMHVRKGVATLVESMVFTPEKIEKLGLPADSLPLGWWVGYRINDEEVWKKVKDGTYPMFSVGGRGKRTPIMEGE